MRLPLSLRAAFYVTSGIVAASGALWLMVHDDSRRAAVACMEVHGTIAMILLALAGAVVALHSATGWREGRNRASGAVLSTALVVLIATGALLYYLGDERARAFASATHWAAGLAAIVLTVLHVRLGQRGAREG